MNLRSNYPLSYIDNLSKQIFLLTHGLRQGPSRLHIEKKLRVREGAITIIDVSLAESDSYFFWGGGGRMESIKHLQTKCGLYMFHRSLPEPRGPALIGVLPLDFIVTFAKPDLPATLLYIYYSLEIS